MFLVRKVRHFFVRMALKNPFRKNRQFFKDIRAKTAFPTPYFFVEIVSLRSRNQYFT